MRKELRLYRTKEGKEPFADWLSKLKDRVGRSHITTRLDRLACNHYGDHKFLGDGIHELRLHYGSGYRIYFSEQEETIILLLLGGNKCTQHSDIIKAKQFWSDFRSRCYD